MTLQKIYHLPESKAIQDSCWSHVSSTDMLHSFNTVQTSRMYKLPQHISQWRSQTNLELNNIGLGLVATVLVLRLQSWM